MDSPVPILDLYTSALAAKAKFYVKFITHINWIAVAVDNLGLKRTNIN